MGSVTAQILQAAAIIAAVATIGSGLWWVIQKVLRPLAIVAEDWRGEPDRPGVPGRPGVMVQLADLRKLVGEESDARQDLTRRVLALEQLLTGDRRVVEATGPVLTTSPVTAERAEVGAGEQIVYGFTGRAA